MKIIITLLLTSLLLHIPMATGRLHGDGLKQTVVDALEEERELFSLTVTITGADGAVKSSNHNVDPTGATSPDVVQDGTDRSQYATCPNEASIRYAEEAPLGQVCTAETPCPPGECCLLPRCVCGKPNSGVPGETCLDVDEGSERTIPPE